MKQGRKGALFGLATVWIAELRLYHLSGEPGNTCLTGQLCVLRDAMYVKHSSCHLKGPPHKDEVTACDIMCMCAYLSLHAYV